MTKKSDKPIKLLIIDDEKEFCALLRDYFQEEGYIIEIAFNGSEGIKKISFFKPDVILLDIRMPKMNGFDALTKIKEFWPNPVVILSAVADLVIARKCLEEGAHSYITKPIDLEKTKLEIEKILINKQI